MSKDRDGKIEILRFIAGLAIAIYHFEWVYFSRPIYFQHFYIWVELFFVISGFFIAFAVSKTYGGGVNVSPFRYIFLRIRKIYPLYLMGFIFSFIVTNIVNMVPIVFWISHLWKAKWEILLCSQFGFDGNITIYNAGGAAGQLSVLFICSLIIYELLEKHKSTYINIIAPVMIIVGIGRIINNYGNLSQWMQYDGFFTAGIIRGFADMSVGVLAATVIFPVIGKSEKRWIVSAGILVPSVFIVLLVLAREQISFNDLIFYIFLFAWLVASIHASSIRMPDKINLIGIYGGKMSYPIFLFHYGVLMIMKKYIPNMDYSGALCIFLSVILLLAAGIVLIEKNMKGLKSRHG